jgi:hypothetical protein
MTSQEKRKRFLIFFPQKFSRKKMLENVFFENRMLSIFGTSMSSLPEDIWYLLIDRYLAHDGKHLLRLFHTGNSKICKIIHSKLKHLRIQFPSVNILKHEFIIPHLMLSRCNALESLTLEDLPPKTFIITLLPNIKKLKLTSHRNTTDDWCDVTLIAPGLAHLDCSEEILINHDSKYPTLMTFSGNHRTFTLSTSTESMTILNNIMILTKTLESLPRTLKHLVLPNGHLQGALYFETFPPLLETLIIPQRGSYYYYYIHAIFANNGPSVLPKSLTNVYVYACPLLLKHLFQLPHLKTLRVHPETKLNLHIPSNLTALHMNTHHLQDLLELLGLVANVLPPQLRDLKIVSAHPSDTCNVINFVSLLPASLTTLEIDFRIQLSQDDYAKLPKGLVSLKLPANDILDTNDALCQLSALETLHTGVIWLSYRFLKLPKSIRHVSFKSTYVDRLLRFPGPFPPLESLTVEGKFDEYTNLQLIENFVSVLPSELRLLVLELKTPPNASFSFIENDLLRLLPPRLTHLGISNTVVRASQLSLLPRSIRQCGLPVIPPHNTNSDELQQLTDHSPPFMKFPTLYMPVTVRCANAPP